MGAVALSQSGVAVSCWGGFWTPSTSQKDVEVAAEKLRGALSGINVGAVPGYDASAILAALEGLETWTDRLLTLSSARRHAVDVLNQLADALDLVQRAVHCSGTEDEIASLFKDAFKAQQAIANEVAKNIPDDSKYLHYRNIAAVLLFLIGVATFITFNVLFPGSGLALAAIATLGPGALTAAWGRISDRLGTADHTDKRLKALTDNIILLTTKLENGAVLQTLGVMRRNQEETLGVMRRDQEAQVKGLETKVLQATEAAEASTAQIEQLKREVAEINTNISRIMLLLEAWRPPVTRQTDSPSPVTYA